jgi:hypothetical protein
MHDARHTPGPWWGDGRGTVIAGEPSNARAVAKLYGTDGTQETLLANERLVAAAPQLLALLRLVLSAAGRANPVELPPQERRAIEDANALLVKISGDDAGTSVAPARHLKQLEPRELLALAGTMPPGCATSALRLAAELRTLEAEAASLARGVLQLLADVQRQPGEPEPLQAPSVWAGEIERAADAAQCWRVWGLGREVRHVVGLLALAVATGNRPTPGGGHA